MQEGWNFFANNFTNHIPTPTTDGHFDLVLLLKKFATATPFTQQVGLSDFAKVDEAGQQEQAPKYPYKLRFEPTGEFTFPDSYHGDFTEDLVSIPSGSLLYKVWRLYCYPSYLFVALGAD